MTKPEYTITEADRRRLAKFRGDCRTCERRHDSPVDACCPLPFDSGNDAFALTDEIKRRGEWDDFKSVCATYWLSVPDVVDILYWTLDTPRIIWLVARWLEDLDKKQAKTMPLTPQTARCSIPPYQAGGLVYMKGSIRFHAPAKRWYVAVYWEGKEEKFWKYNGMPMFDRRYAEKLLSAIQADVEKGMFDPRTYRPNSPLALKEFSSYWIETAQVLKSTKKIYRNAARKAAAFFGESFDIRDLTHSKLLRYKQYLGPGTEELPGLKLSQDAVYNNVTALKTMLRFYKKDVPSFVMPTFPPMSKNEPNEVEWLTFEEQEKALSAIPERHRPIFVIMMDYGLRPQEATALMHDCVTGTHIVFRRSHSEYALIDHTKTGVVRVEKITSRVKAALDMNATMPPSKKGWVFYHNARGSHYDNKILNKLWKKACSDAGVRYVGLYESVRHSLGHQLVEAGYSLDFVQDVYKHTSAKTTRRYAKRQREQVSNALENRGQETMKVQVVK